MMEKINILRDYTSNEYNYMIEMVILNKRGLKGKKK
tara:strand:- start:515 stop:622 length:108 start_codon:yes stop_codon:yes gene_type:complete